MAVPALPQVAVEHRPHPDLDTPPDWVPGLGERAVSRACIVFHARVERGVLQLRTVIGRRPYLDSMDYSNIDGRMRHEIGKCVSF